MMDDGKWKMEEKKWFNIVQYGSMLFKEYIRGMSKKSITRGRIGFSAKLMGRDEHFMINCVKI